MYFSLCLFAGCNNQEPNKDIEYYASSKNAVCAIVNCDSIRESYNNDSVLTIDSYSHKHFKKPKGLSFEHDYVDMESEEYENQLNNKRWKQEVDTLMIDSGNNFSFIHYFYDCCCNEIQPYYIIIEDTVFVKKYRLEIVHIEIDEKGDLEVMGEGCAMDYVSKLHISLVTDLVEDKIVYYRKQLIFDNRAEI